MNPPPDSSQETEKGRATDSETGERVAGLLPRPEGLLLLLVVTAFSLLYTGLSFLRYTEFYAENWDLGINMQAAWTNDHGYFAFSSALSEGVRAQSFYFIHPAYLMYPVSWVYNLAPYALTLFAIQAVVLASSAIPLYLLGRQAAVPPKIAFAGIAIYLASLPILSGFLFDYHWEAFIPASFLWTFYLWGKGRYWWAALPATLGLFTIEVFAALLLAIAAYFAWPYIRALFTPPRKHWDQVRRTLAGPARPLLGLVALAIVGFLGPVFVAWYWLPSLTGATPVFPPPPPHNIIGIPYWGVSASNLGPRLFYWLILLSSFGFLPLLHRQRLLILSIPWVLYSVVMTPNPAFTLIRYHYSLIAVAPLAIGFLEGLGAMTRSSDRESVAGLPFWGWLVLLVPVFVVGVIAPLTLIRPTTTDLWVGLGIALWVLVGFLAMRFVARRRASTPPRDPRGTGPGPARRRTALRVTLIVSLVVLVSSNIALSPLNPATFLGPGEASYSFTYSPSPSFDQMPGLLSHIPSGASVFASDNLFPFVANNPRAYSTFWYPGPIPYLPFNASNLPEVVLLSSTQWFLPTFLNGVLFNQSVYGLVYVIYGNQYPGSIFLYELGYSGSSHVVEATPFPATTVLCGNDLAIGPSGSVAPLSGSRCGSIIESRPATNLSGNNATIWYGPYSDLLPGNYTVKISLRGELSGPGPANSAVLVMNANAAGVPYWYDVVVYENQISPTQWTNLTFHFSLGAPRPLAEWRGYLAGATVSGTFVPGSCQLNYIEVDYTSGPY
jgi:uncharacterized membrane protein